MRCTNYGTLTQDEELNENEKAMLYIKECAELVGLEVIEDETAFSINFMAEIMKRLRKEPKTGHWILTMPKGSEEWAYKCSRCGFYKYTKIINLSKLNYCPNCGARMESEDKE